MTIFLSKTNDYVKKLLCANIGYISSHIILSKSYTFLKTISYANQLM